MLRVNAVPAPRSSAVGNVLACRSENMNQVTAANKDEEIKNNEVNRKNAIMRCEYINQLTDEVRCNKK